MHRGLATPAVLDTYGPERIGHVREIIDEAVAAGRVICELDADRAAARDAEMKQRARDPTPPPGSLRIPGWASRH